MPTDRSLRFGPGTYVAAALLATSALVNPASATNPTADENRLPGTTAWQLENIAPGNGCSGEASRRAIEGYASATSVAAGDTLRLYASCSSGDYTLQFFRIGWYGGMGGRSVSSTLQRTGIWQAAPPPDPVTGLVQCEWSDPYERIVPNDWVSGVYVTVLTALDSGLQNYVPFVVRDDSRASDFLAQLSVITYQAYNCWGGKSLYYFNSTDNVAADKVSFDRPYSRPDGGGEFFDFTIQAVRWLEREDFDVTYCTNVDTHADPDLLAPHKGFLSLGHDEYWTREMREHVASRPDSVSLAFFASNAIYWQVRFEPSQAGVANRTIVGYKEDALAADPFAIDGDPANDAWITTRWRDSPVSEPEAGLIGVQLDPRLLGSPPYQDMIMTGHPAWAFEGTGLAAGDTLPGLVGPEADRCYPSSPMNIQRLARSPVHWVDLVLFVSEMTIYETGWGIVFASGSMGWNWALDDFEGAIIHSPRTHPGAQTLMRNVLERMRTLPPNLGVPSATSEGRILTAWPVPFRQGNLNVRLQKPGAGAVDLGVYDLSGRRVRTLDPRWSASGVVAHWDGRDDAGRLVPAGLWFVRARSNEGTFTTHIPVVR